MKFYLVKFDFWESSVADRLVVNKTMKLDCKLFYKYLLNIIYTTSSRSSIENLNLRSTGMKLPPVDLLVNELIY